MRAKILASVAVALSLTSMIAIAETTHSEFIGQVTPVGAAPSSTKSLKSAGMVPAYSIRVNNNSAFLIYATAYDGYGGQKTFAIDPHYAATIQNNVNPAYGYQIRVVSDIGSLIFDGRVNSLSCVDVYEDARGPLYRVTNYCLQPY